MQVDFTAITPEDFEYLCADLLRYAGFTIESRPARGPDQGKDLIATRTVTDDMEISETQRYLVECKQMAISRKSVQEKDIGNFEIRMKQHKCNRYLLITTTAVSETVKNQLQAVTSDESTVRKATFWAKPELIGRLQKHADIYRKYFRSWQAEAEEAVNYVNGHLFPAHRGALLWCPGVTAVFGNDGYGHPKVQAEIERLRNKLRAQELEELGFSSCGAYSWVVLVKSADAQGLYELIWKCSWISKDHLAYQHERNEALNLLYSFFNRPLKPG